MNERIEHLLNEINDNLKRIISETEDHSNANVVEVVEVPEGPKFSGNWNRRREYILDEVGKALLDKGKEFVEAYGSLPPISFICRQLDIKYHEFTNRFQNKSNFIYFLDEAM